jgi:tetrahydromethanopterin S-methyltransferase subunit D
MKRGFEWIFALGLLVSAGAAFVRLGHPPAARAETGCGAGTLQGTYGIQMQGWLPSSSSAAPTVPFAQIGLLTVDGAGNARVAVTSNAGGQIARDTYTFIYQVSSDCTGSMMPAPGVMAGSTDFVLVDGGKQLFLVVTQAGVVMSGLAIRQ